MKPVTDFIYSIGDEYEQALFDLLYDWWDIIFDVNPPPLDRNGEYLDKTRVIMDLVKAISELDHWDKPIPPGVDPYNLRGRS